MADFKLHPLACATLLFGILFGACHLFPAAPMLRTLSLIGLSLATLSFIILKIRQEWLLGKFYGRCSECKAILSTANLQDIVQSPDRPHCPACKGRDPSKAKITITKAAPQITPKPTPSTKTIPPLRKPSGAADTAPIQPSLMPIEDAVIILRKRIITDILAYRDSNFSLANLDLIYTIKDLPGVDADIISYELNLKNGKLFTEETHYTNPYGGYATTSSALYADTFHEIAMKYQMPPELQAFQTEDDWGLLLDNLLKEAIATLELPQPPDSATTTAINQKLQEQYESLRLKYAVRIPEDFSEQTPEMHITALNFTLTRKYTAVIINLTQKNGKYHLRYQTEYISPSGDVEFAAVQRENHAHTLTPAEALWGEKQIEAALNSTDDSLCQTLPAKDRIKLVIQSNNSESNVQYEGRPLNRYTALMDSLEQLAQYHSAASVQPEATPAGNDAPVQPSLMPIEDAVIVLRKRIIDAIPLDSRHPLEHIKHHMLAYVYWGEANQCAREISPSLQWVENIAFRLDLQNRKLEAFMQRYTDPQGGKARRETVPLTAAEFHRLSLKYCIQPELQAFQTEDDWALLFDASLLKVFDTMKAKQEELNEAHRLERAIVIPAHYAERKPTFAFRKVEYSWDVPYNPVRIQLEIRNGLYHLELSYIFPALQKCHKWEHTLTPAESIWLEEQIEATLNDPDPSALGSPFSDYPMTLVIQKDNGNYNLQYEGVPRNKFSALVRKLQDLVLYHSRLV